MNWVFVGYLIGSLVTSEHATREACEGRRVLLQEKSVIGKCVETPSITWSGPANFSLQNFVGTAN